MAVLTYSGTFGGNNAGSGGLTTMLSASNALPSGAIVSEIQYSIRVSAYPYDSGVNWQLWFFNILGGTSVSGSPYASTPMSSPNDEDVTFAGQMPVYGASAFSGTSISVSVKANCTGSPISYMWQASVTIVYTLPPPASTGSLSASFVDAGSEITIALSNANMASATHVLYWSMGAYNATQNLALGVDTSSFTVPLEWLNAMTSASTGSASVKVTTYFNGVSSGYYTYSFSIIAGSAIVPTISAFTATRIDGDVPSAWEIYVQGKSKVRLQTTASSVYGATIASYYITGDGYIGVSADYTTGYISGYGTIIYTVVVTDTRGKTAQITVQITVYQYSSPTVTDHSVARCLEDGTADETGTYAKAKSTPSISSCNGKNALVTYEVHAKLSTDANYTLIEDEAVADTWYQWGAGAISQVLSYYVKFIVEDAFTTAEIILTLSAALFTIFLKAGGRGIGLGAPTTKIDAVEINPAWVFWTGGNAIKAPLVFTFALDKDDWTGTGPYYQTVSVEGMLASYVNNKIDIDLSATEATMIDQLESWMYVLDGDIKPGDGVINAVCLNDEPTVDLPVRMVVFR